MINPRIVSGLMGELREQIAQWLWEVQPNSTTPWDAIGDFGRDSFRRLADQVLAGPLAPLLAKLQAIYELEATWTYRGEFGWGAWQEGQGPDQEGYILDQAAADIRRALAIDAEPDPFAPGTAVTVHELPGGYLVTPTEPPDEAASTDAAMREAAARDYFGRDYIPIESSFDQPMLGPNVAFRGGWRAAMRAIAALQPPAPNPEEDS